MIIVLDTNVLVSGFLSAYNPPGRILDQIVSSQIQVAFDDRILIEYMEVLARPKFQFEPSRVAAITDQIKTNGFQVSASPLGLADPPDPSDLPFAEVAVASRADALVTGDKSHFDFLGALGVPVVSPSEFLQALNGLAGRSK